VQPVPLRRAGREVGGIDGRPRLAGEEPVVRHEQHRGVRLRPGQELAQELIGPGVELRQRTAEAAHLVALDSRHRRRKEAREEVADGVGAFVVGERQVRLLPEERERDLVVAARGGQHLAQVVDALLLAPLRGKVLPQALVFLRVHVHEAARLRVADAVGGHQLPPHPLPGLGRVDLAVAGAVLVQLEQLIGHAVGDERAPRGLGGPGGPPAHDVRAQPEGGQDGPQRVHTAGVGTDGDQLAGLGVLHQEVRHAMLRGRLAGGDGGPDQGGQQRLDGQQLAAGPARHEPLQVGHAPLLQERPDDEPVGAVPSDHQHLAAGRPGQGGDGGLRGGGRLGVSPGGHVHGHLLRLRARGGQRVQRAPLQALARVTAEGARGLQRARLFGQPRPHHGPHAVQERDPPRGAHPGFLTSGLHREAAVEGDHQGRALRTSQLHLDGMGNGGGRKPQRTRAQRQAPVAAGTVDAGHAAAGAARDRHFLRPHGEQPGPRQGGERHERARDDLRPWTPKEGRDFHPWKEQGGLAAPLGTANAG
jgi:hypothetical protein